MRDSLALVSCLLPFLAHSQHPFRTIWLWHLSFSLSLSFVSSPGRHSFILHAADHSSPSLSFLPRPHRPLFLTSACSSPVPLSSLCTAVEWVLVGSPVSAASQIPGLAALHPGCCTHTTRHHSQKGGGPYGCSTLGNHQGVLSVSVRQSLLRSSFDVRM